MKIPPEAIYSTLLYLLFIQLNQGDIVAAVLSPALKGAVVSNFAGDNVSFREKQAVTENSLTSAHLSCIVEEGTKKS